MRTGKVIEYPTHNEKLHLTDWFNACIVATAAFPNKRVAFPSSPTGIVPLQPPGGWDRPGTGRWAPVMCPVSCPAPVVEMGTTPRFPHFLATAFSSGKWAGNLQLEGQMGHVGNHYQHTGAVPLTDYELVSLKVWFLQEASALGSYWTRILLVLSASRGEDIPCFPCVEGKIPKFLWSLQLPMLKTQKMLVGVLLGPCSPTGEGKMQCDLLQARGCMNHLPKNTGGCISSCSIPAWGLSLFPPPSIHGFQGQRVPEISHAPCQNYLL